MDAAILSREEIAQMAAQEVRAWVERGRRGSIQNPFAALSTHAKEFDAALKRAMGSDDEEGEA